jgi:hypothetical protein
MEAEEKAEVRAGQGANRRAYPHYYVDQDAELLLMDRGSTMHCKVLDFSLGGCRLRTWETFFAGIGVCAEVAFKIRGIDFRFRGVTQWADGQYLLGVRFVDLSERRKEALSEVLSEVAAEYAVEAEKQTVEERTGTEPAREEPARQTPMEASQAAGLFAISGKSERRLQPRQEVNDTAL